MAQKSARQQQQINSQTKQIGHLTGSLDSVKNVNTEISNDLAERTRKSEALLKANHEIGVLAKAHFQKSFSGFRRWKSEDGSNRMEDNYVECLQLLQSEQARNAAITAVMKEFHLGSSSEGVDVRQQLATRWRDVVYEELSPWIKRTYSIP